jgi:nucleotide-binding universal stress UspA family protein
MMRLLVPVDGSPHAERAVQHLIRLAQCREIAPEIHLINVREPVDSWEVRHFLTEEEIGRMQRDEGEEDLRSARALLDAAGLAYDAQVLNGPVAQTIADQAERLHCDAIFMGSHGRGHLAGLFLGSVATKVVHLSRVPVTLVK